MRFVGVGLVVLVLVLVALAPAVLAGPPNLPNPPNVPNLPKIPPIPKTGNHEVDQLLKQIREDLQEALDEVEKELQPGTKSLPAPSDTKCQDVDVNNVDFDPLNPTEPRVDVDQDEESGEVKVTVRVASIQMVIIVQPSCLDEATKPVE